MTPQRARTLEAVAERIIGCAKDRCLLIGIDGVDGAGKTVFADELGAVLTNRGNAVVRASVDGFHRPRAERYLKGKDSPQGYFADSYDYETLKAVLLDPFRTGPPAIFRTAAFDHHSDQPVAPPARALHSPTVLLFDGIFLHRSELRDYWDLSIFLDVSFDVSVGRCALRDGTSPDPAAASNRRYVDGQSYYLGSCDPVDRAGILIDHNDLAAPRILRSGSGAA